MSDKVSDSIAGLWFDKVVGNRRTVLLCSKQNVIFLCSSQLKGTLRHLLCKYDLICKAQFCSCSWLRDISSLVA